MADSLDIRWHQRFNSFRSALERLIDARDIVKDSEDMILSETSLQLLKEGLLQRFEFTQELAWKVMKDYMEYQGINDITGSRDAFRKALGLGLINDKRWMDSIIDRNITSHYYDESEAEAILENVHEIYISLFIEFEKKCYVCRMKNESVSHIGLSTREIENLKSIVFSEDGVDDAVIFGSRAKGIWKQFSDIDIALKGARISRDMLLRLITKAEDSDMPYEMDFVIFSSIKNPALTDHINRVGISLRTL